MRPFKFLRNPIITAHDGGYIFVREFFYTMNKEEIVKYTYMGERKVTPKYTIVSRYIHPMNEHRFKPDYESLWYFRSRENAEYLKTIWEREDESLKTGETFHKQSDIIVTFNR